MKQHPQNSFHLFEKKSVIGHNYAFLSCQTFGLIKSNYTKSIRKYFKKYDFLKILECSLSMSIYIFLSDAASLKKMLEKLAFFK